MIYFLLTDPPLSYLLHRFIIMIGLFSWEIFFFYKHKFILLKTFFFLHTVDTFYLDLSSPNTYPYRVINTSPSVKKGGIDYKKRPDSILLG